MDGVKYAREEKRKELIRHLIDCNMYKHSDGRQLFELSLEELQKKFKEVTCND